jgi:hypothetical protein
MPRPSVPRVYHIVPLDRLGSILETGGLVCAAEVERLGLPGTDIGMAKIKRRRMQIELRSWPGLFVGQCVPFYFCPRSVMLYLIDRRNHPELAYRDGQSKIVHLEANVADVVEWAQSNGQRWAFTGSNAGSQYFNEYTSLGDLDRLDWQAIMARDWRGKQEAKQAEMLVESRVDVSVFRRIGVSNAEVRRQVESLVSIHSYDPTVEVRPDWYY